MMSRAEINAFRTAHNLEPLPVVDAKARAAAKRRQDANRAAHAQLQRDLKSLRSKSKSK